MSDRSLVVSDLGRLAVLSGDVAGKLQGDLAAMENDSSPEIQEKANTLNKQLNIWYNPSICLVLVVIETELHGARLDPKYTCSYRWIKNP